MRSLLRSDLRESRLPGVLRDAVGLGLATALAGWALVSQAASGGSARGAVGVVVATVAVIAGARSLGRRWPWIPPTAVVVAASAVSVVSLIDFAAGRSTDRALGYGNAQARFFLQAVIAGLMVWDARRRGTPRTLALVAVGVFGALALGSGSIAVIGLLALVVVAIDHPVGGCRPTVRGGVCGFCWSSRSQRRSSSASPRDDTGSGGGGVPASLETDLQHALSKARTALWHDALGMISDDPLFGVGPGGFAASA